MTASRPSLWQLGEFSNKEAELQQTLSNWGIVCYKPTRNSVNSSLNIKSWTPAFISFLTSLTSRDRNRWSK